MSDIEKIHDQLFADAHVEIAQLEILYSREYQKDFPFDNWLRKVIVDSFSKGVNYTIDTLKLRSNTTQL